jgi:hypothetical protein
MISVVAEETLETYGAEVIFAEGLDLLRLMNLTPAVLKLPDLVVTHPLSLTYYAIQIL